MSTRGNKTANDLWSEIFADEEQEQQGQKSINVVYRRRRPTNTTNITKDVQIDQFDNDNRLSLIPTKRISWRRSLSTRGRTSIIIFGGAGYQQLRQKEGRKKQKQAPLKRKFAQPSDYEKERLQEYFKEVDSFELEEESPSPKNFGMWPMGSDNEEFRLSQLSLRWRKWLGQKLNYSCGPSSSLSNIMETPRISSETLETIHSDPSVSVNEKTPQKVSTTSMYSCIPNKVGSGLITPELTEGQVPPHRGNVEAVPLDFEGSECIEDAIKRLSLSPQITPAVGDQQYIRLLQVCKQSEPSTLLDVLSRYCDPSVITKIGEGTYGEAYKAGKMVCKVVPFDGDLLVNGEVQKRSAEVLEEVLLSRTLDGLRQNGSHVSNSCTSFIETMDLRVCRGSYDPALIKAWEEWDAKHGSENDHPKAFSEKQCYVVFVLAHGGKDLENYVFSDFDEARSLVVQVTAALAVAEAAYEFEHRDLHWGNILLAHSEIASVQFTLDGRKLWAKSNGLSVSIIDFTLSRINTGEAIHFLDLSSDPELFNGPKRDIQAETYRKMKDLTEDFWEGSFPKTNVYWLQYLVDILLLKKSFQQSSANTRELRLLKKQLNEDLRSLKERLNDYNSAKEALADSFFSDLLMDQPI